MGLLNPIIIFSLIIKVRHQFQRVLRKTQHYTVMKKANKFTA